MGCFFLRVKHHSENEKEIVDKIHKVSMVSVFVLKRGKVRIITGNVQSD